MADVQVEVEDGKDTEESSVKKSKVEQAEDVSVKKPEKSVHTGALNFSNFQMTRVLNVNSMRKQIFVEGNFKGFESPAIVILEKKVFPEDEIFLKRGFFNEGTIVRKSFVNDVYGNYECFPTREHNGNFFQMNSSSHSTHHLPLYADSIIRWFLSTLIYN